MNLLMLNVMQYYAVFFPAILISSHDLIPLFLLNEVLTWPNSKDNYKQDNQTKAAVWHPEIPILGKKKITVRKPYTSSG